MQAVLLQIEGSIATITLNRPERSNTLDMDLARDLRDAACSVANDHEVRCVVLTGAGRMFCSGGDIKAFSQSADPAVLVSGLARTLHDAIATFASMAKPLLVLVNGPAAGAGLSLAIAGDIVLAAQSAHFSAAYTKIGFTPDGGLTWLLPRLVGLRCAQEMILTNRRVSADEAADLGLITRAVPDKNLNSEGHALASELARASTGALAGCRALLLQGLTAELSEQLEAEAVMIGASAVTVDGQEGVAAFLARRSPTFESSASRQLEDSCAKGAS